MSTNNLEIAKEVWNETAMADLLGVTSKQLRWMVLEGGAPAIRLAKGKYIFMAGDVLKWLEAKKSSQG
jgi:predicted site-specific integrase-resolvase